MKKKFIIFILLILISLVSFSFAGTKPQRVLLVGKVIGFEIDEEYEITESEKEVPTGTQKIGTVTFIKEDTYEFAALGHSTIKSESTNMKRTFIKGPCYNVDLEGIKKGSKEEVGGLLASLITNRQIGSIYYDSSYGVFGEMDGIDENYPEVETACWYDVKCGEANILADLDGEGLKSYDVEITNINYINKNKNIKVKITDKNLIAKTGGVVQGMSGTPVMQNRKAYWSNKLCNN